MAEDKALLARLDLAIDKLSDVSADIKAVLAVHESKFENQENLNNTYYDQIEKLHMGVNGPSDVKVSRKVNKKRKKKSIFTRAES